MKFDIIGLFEGIVANYVKLPLSQKIAWPLFVFGTMGIFYFVTQWAARPDYRPLFSGLEEGDAAAIVEKLKEQKIGFQLRDDGRTVEITPPELVHELRLQLATVGLPRSGSVGLELLNDNTLGRTVFQEQVLYLRGLQGELERTIQSIEAVSKVRVHIQIPPKKTLGKSEASPTASVLLRLKAGAQLTPEQTKGISNLVARSVERLTPENVTIVDSKGNLLNDQPTEALSQGLDVTRIQFQKDLESQYSRRIETMLAQVLGAGKAVARVNLDLDFSRHEREEEAYDPGSQVTRSERSVEENGGFSAEGGVPGVVSNLGNAPTSLTPPDSSKGSNLRRENVKNYEVSRAVSKTVSAAGRIIKLSAAVLVDGQYVDGPPGPAGEDGKPTLTKVYKQLSPEMLKQLDSLVKQAVGFEPTRGDIVTVENIRFAENDSNLEQAIQSIQSEPAWEKHLAWIAPGLLVTLFFLIVVRPLVRFLTTPPESEVDLTRLLPAGIEELEAELETERSKVAALPTSTGPTVDIEELEELLATNSRLVRDNPQQAALLIRYWINEGRA